MIVWITFGMSSRSFIFVEEETICGAGWDGVGDVVGVDVAGEVEFAGFDGVVMFVGVFDVVVWDWDGFCGVILKLKLGIGKAIFLFRIWESVIGFNDRYSK